MALSSKVMVREELESLRVEKSLTRLGSVFLEFFEDSAGMNQEIEMS